MRINVYTYTLLVTMEPTIDNIKTYLQQCLKEKRLVKCNFDAIDSEYGSIDPHWTIEDLARFHVIFKLRSYSLVDIYDAWFVCVIITNCTHNIMSKVRDIFIDKPYRKCDIQAYVKECINKEILNIEKNHYYDFCNCSGKEYLACETLSILELAYREKLAIDMTFSEHDMCSDGKL